MIGFKEFIAESRRNPEQNPKVSAYDALLPYHGDPDIYFSMTDIDKIGINPLSKFSTPLGIYTYPLYEAWIEYGIGQKRSLKDLPYAGRREYIWILRAKKSDGFVDDMYTDYGSNNYDADVRTLEKIFHAAGPIRKEFVSYDHDLSTQEAHDKIELYTNMINDAHPDPNDPAQMKLYTSFQTKLKQWQDKLDWLEQSRILTWDELVETALENAKSKNAVMSFWNLSRLLANVITGENPPARKSATKWNSILRQCGYTGFADKSGKGYIHPSEPMQAVFLSRDAFEVVDKVYNKDYAKIELNSFKTIIQYLDGIPNTNSKASAVADFLQFIVSSINKQIKYHFPAGVVVGVPVSTIIAHMGYSECRIFLSRCMFAKDFVSIKFELTQFRKMLEDPSIFNLTQVQRRDLIEDIDEIIRLAD